MSAEKNLRVFIADHDRSFLELVRAQLSAKSIETTAFNKGNDLIDSLERAAAESRMPHVILLSALLPDRNGLELCKKIKEHRTYSVCKVVIISAMQRGGRMEMDARTHFKADDYFVQPIDIKNLPEILKKIAWGDTRTSGPEKRSTAFRVVGSGTATASGAGPKSKSEMRRVAPGSMKAEELDSIFDGGADAVPGTKFGSGRPPKTDFQKRKAPESGSGTTPMRGRLGEVLFPELLLSLYQQRATGVLRLRCQEEERRIWIQSGIPVAVDSNYIVGISLGHLLL